MPKKKDNLLEYIPVRNPAISWTQSDGGTVTLHRENKGFYNRLAQKFFGRPPVSHIDLEKYGSFLWTHIDGHRTIGELARLLKEKYGSEVEPLYERAGQYINILRNNKFVSIQK